jgi:uncharacterized protein
VASEPTDLSPQDRNTLLKIAREAIAPGIAGARKADPEPERYSQRLRKLGAAFVTLNLEGDLRGCIGSLTARRALVVEVASVAHSAAFDDPRFAPLSAAEFPLVNISISVLSPAQPLRFCSESDLLAKLRPGIDGLILSDGPRSGTFLPSVWDKLPRPEQFLSQLRLKAGLPPEYWSDTLRVDRYTTESFSEP